MKNLSGKENYPALGIKILIIIALLFVSGKTYLTISPYINDFFSPTYTNTYYKNLESLFNNSQYRLKNPTAIIPDEIVYSYAAGAYLRGTDPILINSERAPLGKYIISLSIFFLKNDKFPILLFGVISLISLWLLSLEILKSRWLALIPVIITLAEPLFINQLIVTPLLDIIQLPFILLSLYFFIRAKNTGGYLITSSLIGLSMATKTIYTGLLLIGAFSLYLLINKYFKKLINFLLTTLVSFGILTLSYLRTFISGYNIIEFLKFQKWIMLYDKSKIIYPLTIWRLIYVNQWQAWWGDLSLLKAVDWQITWPIFFSLTFILIILVALRKVKSTAGVTVLILWFGVYSIYMSVGIASSRFLIPVLPVTYILGVCLVYMLLNRKFKINLK